MKSMLATVTAKQGHAAELEACIDRLAGQVRREPGNVSFLAYREQGDPSRFTMMEVYESEDAFKRHLKMIHTQQFNEALETLTEAGAAHTVVLDEVAREPATASTSVRGVDHLGMTVPDLEQATRFFNKAFGAVTLYDVQPADAEPMAGPEVESQLGLSPGTSITHMRLLRLGEGPCFELFEMKGAVQRPAASLQDIGLTHPGIYVDDIDQAAERLEMAGGKLLSPPHGLARNEGGERNAGLYAYTPWGMLIELLTYPDGITYPDTSPATRWKPA
ncbi:antibiotic biosynthesis monooxygenase [Larsenimonas rhizosphaerae]|uniref:antibiotic biosynthesis monooxygenase n=1 Tax=Larsenimonas rhizosphaerae TaxID=2944682 RepID=UPI0020347E53|nr:antibiotic biosynthesis monooxygenase [Larsenimonas rhizosphaerae]MCM2129379.1 antibiotic biosynthesis monooxygenase [Larsenimonas rhizosphaerae]